MSKEFIRNQTDDFLNRSQNTESYQTTLLGSFPFPENSGLTQEQKESLNEASSVIGDNSLTGAIRAALPIQISVPAQLTIEDLKTKNDFSRITFTLLINPETLNHGKTHTTTSAYTRDGFVTQLWGPNQDILTSTGKTAVFMVSSLGATTFFRKNSFAFLNFMALINSYKNNGYTMLDRRNPLTQRGDRVRPTRVIDIVNGIELSYDNQIFTGHFSNFTMDESAESPYIFNYNWEFVISTLNKDFSNVRGHFWPLEDRPPEEQGPKGLHNNVKNINDEEIYRTWEELTQLSFFQAIELGFTDGSPEQNRVLYSQLLNRYYETGTIPVQF